VSIITSLQIARVIATRLERQDVCTAFGT